ncbi:MAG: glutamate mutase L [Dehalococcoidia bacterium]|nr:glutamate mutase L [Dehalococcoidia bacterium]
MAGEGTESILAFDCGSAFSRAILVDKVDGEYRFVALGEAHTTPGNFTTGLAEAVRDLEEKTGRAILLGQQVIMPEALDGSGVDSTVLAWSAGKPLRLISTGISAGQLGADTAKVAAGTVAEVVASFCLQDIRRKDRRQQKQKEIRESRADAILFLAGQSSGGLILREICDFLAGLELLGPNGTKLPLLLSGVPAAQAETNKALGAVLGLHGVEPVLSPAGVYSVEAATTHINELYLALSTAGLKSPGSLIGDRWSATVATPKSLAVAAQFIARQTRADVLVVDLDASLTTLVTASQDLGSTVVSTGYGMGQGISGVLAAAGSESITKWLPFSSDEESVVAVGLNKGLRPGTVPQLADELLIEEAFARAAIGYAARGVDITHGLIIGTGGFLTHLPRPGRLALLLLDAFQPAMVTSLAFDPQGLLPSLGAIAHAFPQAAGEVLVKDSLVRLGTVVPVHGSGKDGQVAARIRVIYAGGKETQLDVAWGEIRTIPLGETQTARLLIQPTGEFHIGDGRKGRSVELGVTGGIVGVIIDARGRPLQLPVDERQRIDKISGWYSAMSNTV